VDDRHRDQAFDAGSLRGRKAADGESVRVGGLLASSLSRHDGKMAAGRGQRGYPSAGSAAGQT
jgi:hypothetical protein